MSIFITSTGTNIGKTYINCLLIDFIKNIKKKNISAFKPIISGFNFDETPNDLSEICEALGLEYNKNNIKKISRYFFKEPLSPDMAARISGEKNAEISEIIKFISENQNKNSDYIIIEGAGGAFVPINENENTSDLIAKISDKIILVCGSYLGSLSHTISCISAMKAKNIAPDLIIISQNLTTKDELYINIEETIKSLKNFTDIPIISVAHNKNFSKKAIEEIEFLIL